MKQFFYIATCLLLLGVTSCTDGFEEINTNTNDPANVPPSLLLRQVIYDFGEQMSYEGFVAGDLLAQHRTALDFNLFDRHALKSPQLGGNPWPIFFTNLRDNEIILTQAQERQEYAVYRGPALILKAYMAAGLTDLFGDVPYSQAFDGIDGSVTPMYDTQENIYLLEGGILDNLDKGIMAIETYSGTQALEGDILFNGDLQAWIRFANSLKIKHLLRISDRQDVSEPLQTIFTEGNYIMTNDQNAIFNFSDSEPNSFRLAQLRVGDFNNFVLSKTMENILVDLNDNRLNTLYRPASNTGEFTGLINGIDATTNTAVLGDLSLAGTAFREDTAVLDANFMTAWETSLLLAEASERGLITGDGQALYETGVEMAFAYWQTERPADYFTGNAAYNNPNKTPLEQIITQKWIANVINGYEGWVEYRRTGFPTLMSLQASLNNNLIPVRMPYPPDEEALNAANYQAAFQATDGNNINVKVWWDLD